MVVANGQKTTILNLRASLWNAKSLVQSSFSRPEQPLSTVKKTVVFFTVKLTCYDEGSGYRTLKKTQDVLWSPKASLVTWIREHAATE